METIVDAPQIPVPNEVFKGINDEHTTYSYNDSFRNQPSFNQGGVTGAPATLSPVDALAEFSIQTLGNAEYGRNAGAIVNVAVKSGSNQFHGSAYVFLRNDNRALGSRRAEHQHDGRMQLRQNPTGVTKALPQNYLKFMTFAPC